MMTIYCDLHPPLIRHYTSFWRYYWSGPYYRIWLFTKLREISIEHLQRVRHEDAYSSGHLSCPTLGLASVLMLRPISLELVLSPDFWVSNIPRYFCFCLEPGLKLAITLRQLAAGDKYPTLQFGFRVARNKISTFIPELCQAIVEEYKDEVITCPTASNEWPDIANEYQIVCRHCQK